MIRTKNKHQALIFVVTTWLLSRLLIIIFMQLIAPFLQTHVMHHLSNYSWETFANWDGKFYRQIATSGYEYVNNGKETSAAFFPLFPLITRIVMSLNIPFAVAGTLVNNLAFLGALFILYQWIEKSYGVNTAKCVTIVLAWCPFSLFCTVTYTEGMFLLLSTASLQAFDNRQYAKAAIWGAMATATRVNAVTLLPSFLLVAWRERRPAIAYIAGLATITGLLLFSLYCTIRFGDPIVFVHAQKAWQTQTGFNWNVWEDLTQDLLFHKGGSTAFLALTKVVMLFGGGYLLWYSRTKLSRVIVTYGFCSLALIVASGATLSITRLWKYFCLNRPRCIASRLSPLEIRNNAFVHSHARILLATLFALNVGSLSHYK